VKQTTLYVVTFADLLAVMACSPNSSHMTNFITIVMVWLMMSSDSLIGGLGIDDTTVCEVEASDAD
jgi:hypothetical protein